MKDDGTFLGMCMLLLCGAVLALARKVASLEEDIDLLHVAAGSPANLYEAKKAIEKRAAERAEERGLK